MDATIRSAIPQPFLRELDPLRMVRSLWAKRELIRTITVRDLAARYRGAKLGFAWAFLTPALQMLVYTFVFSVVLSVRLTGRESETTTQYAVLLFAGLSAFALFAESIGRAPGLIVGRRHLVKKVQFPLEILPVTMVFTSLFTAILGILLAMIAHLALGGAVGLHALLTPLVLVPALLVAVGVSWILAALGVYFRDLQQLVGAIVQRLLFFLTPIIYPIERVPEAVRPVLYLNPMTPVVEGVRRTLLLDRAPEWGPLAIWTVIGLALCVGGHALFMRTRRGFADVL